MRNLARGRFPGLPLIAAFETGFHRTIPEAHQRYAVPEEWATEHGIRRWGFHGASHCFIAGRMAVLLGRPDAKVISCHLGGSSSICAIRDGAIRRVQPGDEPAERPPAEQPRRRLRRLRPAGHHGGDGASLDEILDTLANRSGLLGLGGAGNDLRDIEAAAEAGDPRARLALEVLIASVRHYLGAYLLELGGADAIVFTGGIGENSAGSARASSATSSGSASRSTGPPTPRADRPSASSRPRLPRAGLGRSDERGDRRGSTVARPAERRRSLTKKAQRHKVVKKRAKI